MLNTVRFKNNSDRQGISNQVLVIEVKQSINLSPDIRDY